MAPRSRPGPIVPDQRTPAEPETGRSARRARSSANSWVDLAALISIMAVPLLLVLVGRAGVAVIVAASEFVLVVLRAWHRNRGS
jgi:hypothetical protein